MALDEAMATDLEKLTITPSGHTVENGEVPKVPRVDWAKYSKRVLVKKIVGRPDGGAGLVGERVVVGGWVKSGREQGKSSYAFLEVNDGSCPADLQVRIPLCLRSLMRLVVGNNATNGSAGKVSGGNTNGNVKAEPAPGRTTTSVAYLQINDGSCSSNLQAPKNAEILVLTCSVKISNLDSSIASLNQLTPRGTSILVEGVLKQPTERKQQKVELKVEKVLQVGTVDPAKYPIGKTRLPLSFLRNYAHLRPRTNTISSVARIRNALAYATHTFFQNHGFLYVHTPIITTTVREGAGDMFQVTTLFSEADKIEREQRAINQPTEADLEAAKASVKEKGEKVQELKSNNSDKPTTDAALAELQKAKDQISKMEERFKLKPCIPLKDGKLDYSQDFFSRQAYLTVSGQLQVESYACALSSVYTFGPTFRADNSHTTRHLAEFWMVEPEMAFADLEDDMNCAEDYVKFLCQWLLDNCFDDMKFMSNMFDKTAIDRLRLVASTPFERITYTEAVELLKKVSCQSFSCDYNEQVTDKKFENQVEWGIDLALEHERYLTEEVFKKPVIVYNYPKDIKSFYMRLNDDGKTVAAMNVLVPKVGELIGGSQREERYEVIDKRIQEKGLPREPYEWYLDLRRYGTVKHSGFGLGFERMVLFATGLDDIGDAIPFPRRQGKADH
eukprot:Gb_13621 [translate_table: standard]